MIIKFIWKDECMRMADKILKYQNVVLPTHYQRYYKATVIKAAWYRYRIRQLNQGSTTKSLEKIGIYMGIKYMTKIAFDISENRIDY